MVIPKACVNSPTYLLPLTADIVFLVSKIMPKRVYNFGNNSKSKILIFLVYVQRYYSALNGYLFFLYNPKISLSGRKPF